MTVLGLPLHPLIVHFAVILVPLAATGLIATGWRPAWRQHYLLPLMLLAIAGAGATLIATASGEALQHSVRDAAASAGVRISLGEHPEEGDEARLWAMIFAAAVVGLWAIERWGTRLQLKPWSGTAAYVLTSGAGLLAIATMAVAGHSGAQLVWRDVGSLIRR